MILFQKISIYLKFPLVDEEVEFIVFSKKEVTSLRYFFGITFKFETSTIDEKHRRAFGGM